MIKEFQRYSLSKKTSGKNSSLPDEYWIALMN